MDWREPLWLESCSFMEIQVRALGLPLQMEF